jgi:hypothetical protein
MAGEIQALAREARNYEQRAEKLEEDAEDCRWLAARRYHQAVDVQKCAPGEFAKLVGKSTGHVRAMRLVWQTYGDHQARRSNWSFWMHYQTFKNAGKEPRERWGDRPGRDENLSPPDSSSIIDALTSDGDVVQEIVQNPAARNAIISALGASKASTHPVPAPPVSSVNDEWHRWLYRANGLFTDGARLAARTDAEPAQLDAHAEAARVLYDRLIERQLDAEIRAFMDAEAR